MSIYLMKETRKRKFKAGLKKGGNKGRKLGNNVGKRKEE